MFWNICWKGTALSLTLAPGFAPSNPAMALLKPASSESLPQVVKVSSPPLVDGSDLEKPAQPDSVAPAERAPTAPRKWRRVNCLAGLLAGVDRPAVGPDVLVGGSGRR